MLHLEEVHSDLMLKYTKLKLRAKDAGEKGFDSDSEDKLALVASGSSGGSNGGSSNVSKKLNGSAIHVTNKVTSPLTTKKTFRPFNSN